MAKKNVRMKVKVRKSCSGLWYDIGIYDGRKMLLSTWPKDYERKGNAIRAAKKMAKRIGIPYDPEIIKQHGC